MSMHLLRLNHKHYKLRPPLRLIIAIICSRPRYLINLESHLVQIDINKLDFDWI